MSITTKKMNKYSKLLNSTFIIMLIVFLSFTMFEDVLFNERYLIFSAIIGVAVLLLGFIAILLHSLEKHKKKNNK
jgi:membrane protein required for beta-lactamase induction